MITRFTAVVLLLMYFTVVGLTSQRAYASRCPLKGLSSQCILISDQRLYVWKEDAPGALPYQSRSQRPENSASTYCSSVLGEQWRLPTLKEIVSIYDYVGNGQLARTWYWTSDNVFPQKSWAINFSNMSDAIVSHEERLSVRCVRKM